MGSGNPGSCKIVMGPLASDHSNRDARGNIFLSRDPASPLQGLSTKFDNQEKRVSVE